MNKRWMRRMAALGMVMVLLTGSAAALFGKKQETEAVEEGAPVAHDIAISTYCGIPCEAQFMASDSEGDDMTFSVERKPKKGTVSIDGVNFVYTPGDRASGGDAFTYVAVDSAGHTSAPATVTVSIEKTRSGVMYSDTDEATAASAQYLAEEGIFVGAKLGEQYYFEPDRPVSRSEFVAMVLEMTGQEVTEVTMTGFCDDASIPVWAKAYAAAGVAGGIIQGKRTEDGAAFRGGESITFNEAATVLDRVLDTEDVDLDEWYFDRESVPSWAAQAVGNMEALSVLAAGSFGSQTMEQAVTRADAAQMLSAADTLLSGDEPEGLFGWMKR